MADSFVIIASLTVAKLDRNGNAIVAIISKIFVSSLINVRRDFDFVGIIIEAHHRMAVWRSRTNLGKRKKNTTIELNIA